MKAFAPVLAGIAFLASICFGCWLIDSGWPLLLILCVDEVMAAARG